jgi:hypothetical protein
MLHACTVAWLPSPFLCVGWLAFCTTFGAQRSVAPLGLRLTHSFKGEAQRHVTLVMRRWGFAPFCAA